MKFKCNRSIFSKYLSFVNNIIPSRCVRPVLQNVCITGNADNTITLSGTDMEVGVAINMPVEDLKEASKILINSSVFTGIVCEEKSEYAFFETNQDKAKMVTEHGKYEFPVSLEEFPEIRKIEEKYITINAKELCEAITLTKFSVSTNIGKYAFNGIFVNIEEDKVDFVSSDGNRLSLVSKRAENTNALKVGSVVITKGMVALERLIKEEKEIKLGFCGNEMVAEIGNMRLVSRLIDGKFPSYRGVIPTETIIKVTVNKDEMLNALRLITKMSTEGVRSLRLDAANDKLVVSLNSGFSGSGTYEIAAAVEGGEISTAFNCNYLIDGINSLKNNEITLNLIQSGKPLLLCENDYKHIITPVGKESV